MDAASIKTINLILRHHGIPFVFIGELALNYYNVPRVLHDIEICVPRNLIHVAAGTLFSTGLFEPCELENLNLYTNYKQGMPRLVTTGWIEPPRNVCIFPDSSLGLSAVEKVITSPLVDTGKKVFASKEILAMEDMDASAVANLPFPRLPPLLIGYAQRYLDVRDDTAMIAAEQLVDGMDVDDAWCERHLAGQKQELSSLVRNLVEGKASRLDEFNGNEVTCFVKDQEEVVSLRQISGYD